IIIAVIFYALSVALLLWEFFSDQNSFSYKNLDNPRSFNFDLSNRQINMLIASIFFLVLAFFAFRKNELNEIYFNFLNLSLWAISLILFLAATLERDDLNKTLNKWKSSVNDKQIFIKLTPWLIFLIISTIIVFYFRFYRLNEVL